MPHLKFTVMMAMLMAVMAAVLLTATDLGIHDPIFHLFTPGHWINDPNGPYRDPVTGTIHLYMQYNPYSAIWGNMSWYHVTSEDYVTWRRHDPNVALANDKWFDRRGVYSGSMMNNKEGVPVAVYTCVEEGDAEQVAQNIIDIQRQCVATPPKEDLKGKRTFDTLVKSPLNPVMTELDVPGLVGLGNFRDPIGWWPDPANASRFLIGFVARINDEDGDNAHVILFSTEDPTFLSGYKFSHSLYMYKYDIDHMFECPDFFTIDPEGDYYLKLSTMPSHRDYIVYGSYQESEDDKDKYVYVEDPKRTYTFIDYGPFYASKTFYDPVLKRRMIWGWVNEEMDQSQWPEIVGWSGVQVLRGIAYDEAQKRLKYPPIPEMKALRERRLVNKTLTLKNNGVVTVLNASSDATTHQEIVIKFTVPKNLFDVSKSYTEKTAPEIGVRIRTNALGDQYTTVSVKMPATPEELNGQAYEYPDPRAATFKVFDIDNAPSDAAAACSRECANMRTCESWTLRPALKSGAPQCSLYWNTSSGVLKSLTGASSGVVNEPLLHFDREKSGTVGYTYSLHGRAPLESSTTIELRIFVDSSVVEVFKDDGAQTLSGRIYLPHGDAHSGVALYTKNTGGDVEASVQVYAMRSMWEAPKSNVVDGFTDALRKLLTALVHV